MNLDTSTPTGKLLLTMLGPVYQFERELLLERQLVRIAQAKREGKFKGRVPTAKRKSGDIQRLFKEGFKPKQNAADPFYISRGNKSKEIMILSVFVEKGTVP